MNRKTILLSLVVLAVCFVFLRTCVPQLWGQSLPDSVVRRITDDHTVCIGVEDVPIWPGEPRQAQCGPVTVDVVADGAIPAEQAAAGVSKAVCYVMTVEHPYWEVMGQTRHEILTSVRTFYKVTVLQDDEWVLFPDEDVQDRDRWSLYGCPTPTVTP